MNLLTVIKLLAPLSATLALLVTAPAFAGEMGGMHQHPMEPPGIPGGVTSGMRPSRPAPQLPGARLPDSPPTREQRPDVSSTTITFRGTSYFVSGGQWYERRGAELVAVDAPAGVLVRELPKGYSMRWIGGAPYFYADGIYYVWRERLRRYEIMQNAPGEETAPPHERAPAP